MRIRTIKPEFWSHPVLAKLSDHTRLIALGLLNFADDEGLFVADPRLVRAALTPFSEDSVSIHGALTELSRAGWIELMEHAQMGALGRIVNFRKHQVINRPTRSKLTTYWDSLNPHGGLTECSVPDLGSQGTRERGGEGGAGPCPAATDAPPPPPAPIGMGDTKRQEAEAERQARKAKAREQLATALRRAGMPAGQEALTEWADLLQGIARCQSVGECCHAIQWISQQRSTKGERIKYARDAGELAELWGRRKAEMAEEAAPAGQGAQNDAIDGPEEGAEEEIDPTEANLTTV